MKRFNQGWVLEIEDNVNRLIERIVVCKRDKIGTSIAYYGNIVDVLESLVDYYNKTGVNLVDLCSDQTSCHNPFLGGYFPVQVKLNKLIINL